LFGSPVSQLFLLLTLLRYQSEQPLLFLYIDMLINRILVVDRAMIAAHMRIDGGSRKDTHASPANMTVALCASYMIAAIHFLDQCLTCWAFLHEPAMSCQPCLRFSLLFSNTSSLPLVFGTVHAVVDVIMARCTYT
jgi:hypothetical protein